MNKKKLWSSDKEILELAAKVAGINLQWMLIGPVEISDDVITKWNPLNSDSDALKLAVLLGITITPYPIYANPKHSVIAKKYSNKDNMRETNTSEVIEIYNDDPMSATRRAIVRCAASLSLGFVVE